MKINLLITLCARGGSKGIPGKNIKLLNGLPLISYSIKSAKEFGGRYNAQIALSTDDDQIKKVAAYHVGNSHICRSYSHSGERDGKFRQSSGEGEE